MGFREFSNHLFVAMPIIALLFVVAFTYADLTDYSKFNDYCKENDWDGASGKLGQYECYNEFIHESGTGTERVYSGELDRVVVWGTK